MIDDLDANMALPMLPEAQVAVLLEQLRAEQARLLREQQDAIIALVMRNLNEKGISQAASNLVNTHPAEVKAAAPSKLEQSLHALVLHSLEETGLEYPHVLRTTFPSEQPPRSKCPSPSHSLDRSGKATIVSRHETAQGEDQSHDLHPVDDRMDPPEALSQSSRSMNRSVKKKPMSALVAKSPLRDIIPGRDSRRSKPRTHRRQRRSSTQGLDDEFESVRTKLGHKTLAILDRSRALLDDVKKHQHASGGGSTASTFVTRMREALVTPQAQDSVEDEPHHVGCTARVFRPPSPPAAECARSSHREDNQTDACQKISNSTETLEPGAPVLPMAEPNAACSEIEILKPPAHSPENENEWENELARQILTIYATSVKAKQFPARPFSHESTRADSAILRKKSSPLGESCSLPAINRVHRAPTAVNHRRDGARSRSPPRAAVQYSWEPSQRLHDGRVVVNMPKVPKPIWFAGTGAVKAVWCAIAQGFEGLHASPGRAKSKPRGVGSTDAAAVCEHQLCEEVRRLEAKQQYSQCITTIETLLVSLVRARGVDTLDAKLWKQLVVTCNAFASRCVDYKKFAVALQLIKQAEHLLHNSILVDDAMRFELLAYLYDTYAHYYYRRGKSHAGLQYMLKAHEIHARQSSWAHLAKCRLHIANLLSQQGKHQDAMGYMASILEMIEARKLEDPPDQANGDSAGASAQKVCLAAVCYNNLAIEQLHLRAFEAASVSTGNAKRLARLCLSYSNRWLAQFDATSSCVDQAIATLMEDVNAAANAPYKT